MYTTARLVLPGAVSLLQRKFDTRMRSSTSSATMNSRAYSTFELQYVVMAVMRLPVVTFSASSGITKKEMRKQTNYTMECEGGTIAPSMARVTAGKIVLLSSPFAIWGYYIIVSISSLSAEKDDYE